MARDERSAARERLDAFAARAEEASTARAEEDSRLLSEGRWHRGYEGRHHRALADDAEEREQMITHVGHQREWILRDGDEERRLDSLNKALVEAEVLRGNVPIDEEKTDFYNRPWRRTT